MQSRNKVLVVDDLEINRKVLDGYLSTDYEVYLAEGGLEALEVLRREEVQLAILDVNMPGMTGLELAAKIREIPSCEELPIIFVTGAALEQDHILEGLSVGAVDYLCKPYDMKVLFMKVKNFVELRCKELALKKEIKFRRESQEKLLFSLEREQKLKEQLKLAEKMEAIGRLSSGISHDFNNLMTALTGHTELLQKTSMSEEQQKHLAAILTICSTGIDISEKLKVFSRQRSTRKKEFNISSLVKDLKEMCEFSIEQHIKKVFELPDEKLRVYGSSSDILNCLLNIILNARDSIEDNGQIEVKCQKEYLSQFYCDANPLFRIEPGLFVCISVEDDGAGMDEETLHKIFEPFFSTKGNLGTGLGMATSFGTVSDHRGAISVKSQLGEGTCIKVYLPLKAEVAVEEKPQTSIDKDLRGKHILVVDDEEKNLAYMKILFETYGAKVEDYISAKESLVYFGQKYDQIDLVVIDYIMPDLNGRALLQKMREIDPNLNCIMVSGVCDQSEVEKLRAGGVEVMTKPFHAEDFIDKMQELT